MSTASCDCCGKTRWCTGPHNVQGIETFACWECRGDAPECDVCGEELDKDGICRWCYGNKNLDEIRSMLQKMERDNKETLDLLRSLEDLI